MNASAADDEVPDPDEPRPADPAVEGAFVELTQRFFDLVRITFDRPEVRELTGSDAASAALRAQLEPELWEERPLLAERSAARYATLMGARRRASTLGGRIPGRRRSARLRALHREVRRAEDEWEQAVVEEGLLRVALAEIGDEAAWTETGVGPLDTGRLLASDDSQPFVATAASDRVEALLAAARSIVVAVGGERGVGKSSLLRHVTRTTTPGRALGVVVAAPAEGPPQEFVVHLFAEVCRAILDHGGLAGDDEPTAIRLPSSWPSRLAAAVTATATVATAGLLVWSAIETTAGWAAARPVAWWTALVAVAGAATTAGLRWRARRRLPETTDDVLRLASHHLARLRFLSSDKAESSAAVDLGRGVKLGRTWGRQRTEQPRTHPQLVADLRRFLERAGLSLRAAPVPVARIVVAVDELDKLDEAAADRFMRELRAIVGTPGCHYVVAVSEPAVRAFEQRLIDGATAVDSTFDAVVRLPGLTLQESRQVLWSRVALPVPCVLLCHVLSGGRARDLLRTARSLAELRNDQGVHDLADIARHFVRRDRGRLAGSLGDEGAVRLDEAKAEDVDAWLAAASGTVTPSTAAYAYHLATVQWAFVERLGETLAGCAASEPARDGLADLARARLDIAARPRAAWDVVSAYRNARGWPIVPWPSPLVDR